jgi:hypothetical protein
MLSRTPDCGHNTLVSRFAYRPILADGLGEEDLVGDKVANAGDDIRDGAHQHG